MPDNEPIEILLVEDNPADARLVELLLSEAGPSGSFNIVHAERLGEALQRLEESTFGVILLDLSLPDSSGLETVNRMRAATSELPVVVLSGQDDEETALRALQNGAEDYLVKGRGDGELIARSVRYSMQRKSAEATLRQREKQLAELVGRLVAAQEEERRSIAYEIHDGLTQVAIAAHQQLQIFAEDHPPGSRVESGELDRALSLAQRVVREARHVIEGLRPTALDDFGLAAALRLMVEEFREEEWEVVYEENLGAKRLTPEAETGLYRVAQEALSNARKHAGTREVRLKLALAKRNAKRKLRLEVEDKGRGFDPRAMRRAGGPGERIGLAGMRERVGLLGGELTIESEPGEGTCVIAEVPLEGPLEVPLEEVRKD